MGQSLISPVFLQNAEDLLRRLDAVPGPEARALGAEAQDLADLFRSWLSHRADDAERTAAIRRFLDLYRRASEFLAHHQPPSSGKSAPPTASCPPPSSGHNIPRVHDDEDDD